ncbi:GntR family transcriptional regulator [Rhizobium sophorae]|uniref:GntR family transcriptional regulator n=1 Tax=Rhizobium sophorae TaxID=1535242 RepID=A0A7Y3S196_9HYPH|nr:GntR family transcriptional regulator [Rhizobium sophorae]MBX4862792.1 GntR family transcriptional regulator [Rhizobium bangladeshense]NNU35179.1 GntR family transcriptional regulator [Rhizobium sophorae]
MILDTEKTRSEAATDKIRTLILSGTYRPGQPLRQEALSGHLSISRTPLRHALQSLAEEGLVEAVGFKGARVAQPDPQMVRDLFDMRLLLEPLALKSALEHHTKLDFAKAEMALDAADAEHDLYKLSQLNWEFHHALYRPSGRRTLMRTIEHLNRASAFAETIAKSIVVRSEKSAAEHRELLQACRNADADGAIDRLTEHLQLAYRDIQNTEY